MPPKKDVKQSSKVRAAKDEDIPILNFLYENNNVDENGAIKTIEIAKGVFGEEAKKKMVNPGLYRLLNLKMVVKFVNEKGTNPRWCLSQGWSPSSNNVNNESQTIIINMLPSTSTQVATSEKTETVEEKVETVEEIVPSMSSSVLPATPPLPQGFIALNLTGDTQSEENRTLLQIATEQTVLPPMPSPVFP